MMMIVLLLAWAAALWGGVLAIFSTGETKIDGLGFLAFALFLAVFARIRQAVGHQDELLRALKRPSVEPTTDETTVSQP